MPKTQSEKTFERYCNTKGIVLRRIPPSTDTHTKTPDYELFIKGQRITVEVKEFFSDADKAALESSQKGHPYISIINQRPGNRVQRKSRKAALQLKTASQHQDPTILVLFDQGMPHRLVDPYQIKTALSGFDEIRIPYPHPPTPSIHLYRTRPTCSSSDNKDTSRFKEISAIGTLIQPNENEIILILYHNKHAYVPLDPALFAHYNVPQYRLEYNCSAGTTKLIPVGS